jgi:membrane-associated phospholipid phosphatase
VCFPSFHAAWAVLAALALWSVKPLRVPAVVLASLIVISTVTTGWHYAVDTLAGVSLAIGAWKFAGVILAAVCSLSLRRAQNPKTCNPALDGPPCHFPAPTCPTDAQPSI